MAVHVTAASVHDFKLFSYFFALFFLIFLVIDACDLKKIDFYSSHFIHAFCLFTSIYTVLPRSIAPPFYHQNSRLSRFPR